MRIYNYDASSGELLESEEADADPLTPGAFLIPAHATTLEPPPINDFQSAVFDERAEAWHVVDVSARRADDVLRSIAQHLAAIGPLFDAYADLAALGELDEDGLAYLQALRVYRVELRQVHMQPGFPQRYEMPHMPALRSVPDDPLRPAGEATSTTTATSEEGGDHATS
jgi:hypothetical protein